LWNSNSVLRIWYTNIYISSSSTWQLIEGHCCHHETSSFLCYMNCLNFISSFIFLMSWATTSTLWVLSLPNEDFLFICLIKTSFITYPSTLQTCPNHSRCLLFIYNKIFGLLYNSYSSWFFLLSYVCNSGLKLGLYVSQDLFFKCN